MLESDIVSIHWEWIHKTTQRDEELLFANDDAHARYDAATRRGPMPLTRHEIAELFAVTIDDPSMDGVTGGYAHTDGTVSVSLEGGTAADWGRPISLPEEA